MNDVEQTRSRVSHEQRLKPAFSGSLGAADRLDARGHGVLPATSADLSEVEQAACAFASLTVACRKKNTLEVAMRVDGQVRDAYEDLLAAVRRYGVKQALKEHKGLVALAKPFLLLGRRDFLASAKPRRVRLEKEASHE